MKTITNERTKVERTIGLRWQLGLAFLAFILIGANDGGVGVILPSLREYYGVDKATVGFMFLAGTAGYLIAGFSSGLLVEKLGPRVFLMLGSSFFVVGVFIVSLRPIFGLLLATFLILGFGVAILDAGLNAYIARLPNSTPILNYLHAFYAAGAFIGPLIASGILALGASWNNLYLVWIGLGLVVLAGFAVLYNGRGQTSAQERAAGKNDGNVMLVALRVRAVWIAAFFLLFYTGAEVTTGSWGYTFLTEDRHQEIVLAGWMVSGYWLGLMLGRLILGKLSERIGGKNLIQGCLVGVVVGLMLVWLVPIGIAAAIGLFVTGFSLGPIFPTTIALMPTLVPDRIVATAIGFLASFAATGAALMPWLAGNLAQGAGLWTLLPFVMVLALADLGLWLVLQRTPKPVAV